jgi:hypothetical protein
MHDVIFLDIHDPSLIVVVGVSADRAARRSLSAPKMPLLGKLSGIVNRAYLWPQAVRTGEIHCRYHSSFRTHAPMASSAAPRQIAQALIGYGACAGDSLSERNQQ